MHFYKTEPESIIYNKNIKTAANKRYWNVEIWQSVLDPSGNGINYNKIIITI